MDSVHIALRRLLTGFVVWFVLQTVLGAAVAVQVIEGLKQHPLLSDVLRSVTPDFTIGSGVIGSLVLLALAIPVFAALKDLRNWARCLLLVVGWITVVGAVASLLGAGAVGSLVRQSRAVRTDWLVVEMGNVVTKAIDLAFWSWLIYTLQGNPHVREAFRNAARPCGTAVTGS